VNDPAALAELHHYGAQLAAEGCDRGQVAESLLRKARAEGLWEHLGADYMGVIDTIAGRVLPGANGASRAVDRPSIQLDDRQLDAVIDDAVAALIRANNPPELFLRAGAVVVIRRDEEARPVVAQVNETALLERLASAARWYRGTSKKLREAGPTRELAAVVLQRLLRAEGVLPPLRGVTASPLMRANGSILDEPGYDAATRLYYAPSRGLDMGVVPETPSPDQVRAALQPLDELFFDFPFVGDADAAAALALLLTLLLREIFEGCAPLWLYDAPAPGTGKGLIADTITTVATGAAAPKMPEPDGRGDDEWRKRLTALLLEGRSVAVLDNLERPLGSASLATALTAEVWEDRALGASQMIMVPNRAVFIATGNNLRLRGDLPRRCVWCRLDAKHARPWTRDGFQHPDLLGWARDHRGELLNAVFTLARAWIAAGRPGPDESVPRLGSFEGWRHTIGGILGVAGLPGFLANVAQLYETADEETPAWAAFLAAWRTVFGSEAATVADLIERMKKNIHGPLAEALPGELAEALEKPSAAKRIGRALARKAETRFTLDDGATLRLARERDTHAKVLRWRVEKG